MHATREHLKQRGFSFFLFVFFAKSTTFLTRTLQGIVVAARRVFPKLIGQVAWANECLTISNKLLCIFSLPSPLKLHANALTCEQLKRPPGHARLLVAGTGKRFEV